MAKKQFVPKGFIPKADYDDLYQQALAHGKEVTKQLKKEGCEDAFFIGQASVSRRLKELCDDYNSSTNKIQ